MTRETATQRRAREAREAREQQAAWEKDLPMFVLRELARAHSLGVRTEVLAKDGSVEARFLFDTDNLGYLNSCVISVGNKCSQEYEAGDVSYCLDNAEVRLREERRQREVRQTALGKLTDEERAALGV